MAALVGLLLCLAAFQSTVSADLRSEYAQYAVLDPAEKMKLFWTADWDAKTVSFALEAETTGWVEFGFSDGTGQMVGSDVVIGWVKNNKGYLTDRFVTSDSIPTIDKQQDYELTGSQESGGKTVLKFIRKFDTCDPQDRKLEQGATNLVYAYGTEDPGSPMNIIKEVYKGSRSVLLLSKLDTRNIDKTGWTSFNMTANVTLPAHASTTFWCTLVKGPKLTSKHHITASEPIFKKGNEGLVHHYVLYGCHGTFTESDFQEGVPCLATRIMYAKCQKRHMIAVYTVGGEAVYLPPRVGIPIGDGNDSPNVFLLEIAYDNPQQIKGRQDSSGVRVYYTDKLRENDGGIISVGVDINDWQIVPPRQKNWISTGYCMHQCTESMFKQTSLPDGGIKIFAAQIHIHWAGRAGWTKHVRNGIELPEIARLNNYDFEFQDTPFLPEEVHIQPGDDIIQYCKYDSMNRDKLMKGGFPTQDEMCLSLLYYYPRVPGLSLCRSTSFEPSLKLLKKYFNVTVNVKNNTLAQLDFAWNNTMVADFKKYEHEVNAVVPKCLLNNVTTVDDIDKFNRQIPKITKHLPPAKSDCPKEAASPSPVSSQPHSTSALFFGTLCSVFAALY